MTKNPRNYSLLSDAYEFMMADAYLRNGKQDLRAVFDVYFRKTPNNGGYAVMAGLDKIVDYLQNIHFEKEDIGAEIRKKYEDNGYVVYCRYRVLTRAIWRLCRINNRFYLFGTHNYLCVAVVRTLFLEKENYIFTR